MNLCLGELENIIRGEKYTIVHRDSYMSAVLQTIVLDYDVIEYAQSKAIKLILKVKGKRKAQELIVFDESITILKGYIDLNARTQTVDKKGSTRLMFLNPSEFKTNEETIFFKNYGKIVS